MITFSPFWFGNGRKTSKITKKYHIFLDIRTYREFWDVLDAINRYRESLYDVFEVLIFWSTFVDLLVNISTLLGLKRVKKRQKSHKNSTFSQIFSILTSSEVF